MKVTITDHAKKRIKQRLGIPYKGALKHAARAFKGGRIIQPLEGHTRMLINYRGYEYVYSLDREHQCPRLVTVYPENK